MILPWIVFSLAIIFLFLIVLSSGNQSFLFFLCLFFLLMFGRGGSNGFQIRYHSVQEFFSSMAEEGLVVSTFSFFWLGGFGRRGSRDWPKMQYDTSHVQ